MPGEVFYGVIPRSFSARGLDGVADRLPYLRDLGVTAVWLSPVFEHGPRDFGYGVTDFRRLDPEFGDVDDLRRLVSAAHDVGLKVLLDVAVNHTSEDHPMYRDLRASPETSAYRGYYVTDADGAGEHYFDWSNLMNLDYARPGVRTLMLDALAYWIDVCDVDGYRMDAVWGIRDRTPDFLHECVQALRERKPDVYLLAEASALDDFYVDAGFDTAYDWTHELGVWGWQQALSAERGVAAMLAEQLAACARPGQVFRFLNNNDTGARFVTAHGRDRYRLATALLLTLPGDPCLYMGDEVGLEFLPYKQREPLVWHDDDELLEFHRRLIALRARHLADASGLEILDVSGADDCLAYAQTGSDGSRIVCVLNFGPPATAAVDLGAVAGNATSLWPDSPPVRVSGQTLTVDLLTDEFAIVALSWPGLPR